MKHSRINIRQTQGRFIYT